MGGCCLSFAPRDPTLQLPLLVLHWTQIFTLPAVFPAVAFWLLADWRDISVGSSGIPFVSFPEFRLTLMLVSDPSLMQRNV